MSLRDYRRIVLAEDEPQRALEMSQVLESLGNYEVRTTKYKREVLDLVDQMSAGWLILDLNLEDGNSAELVPRIREEYGEEVIVIVLSGYFEDYPEHSLLSEGVDLYLRKPYSPKAMLMQMESLRARIEGGGVRKQAGVKLKIGEGVYDVDTRTYKVGKKEVRIAKTPSKMIAVLASARDADGWVFVERGQIAIYLWGEDAASDPNYFTSNTRRLRYELKQIFSEDIIEATGQGRWLVPQYKLSSDVKSIEEEQV
ncbi:MAG: response regulator [Anaerolineales bacterium]|nr:response regulator [Anaerolineales bacterium]